MSILNLIITLSCVFIFSIITTGTIRQYSIRKSLIDIPNNRSSHTSPTPRGGGLSIALSILICLSIIYYLEVISSEIFLALGGGGLVVAVIGWIDDHIDISIILRVFGYTIAALWSIYWVGGLNSIALGDYVIGLNNLGYFFAVLGVVWITNLYNFMDGTDAFAAMQAICVALFSSYFFLMYERYDLALICLIISSANFGFLYWNWPPAKIFMGDVGSCLIGFCFGILAILGENSGTLPIMIWFIMLAIFIFDATLTLLMRIIKKEKWYKAHRSHAYQRLIQMGVTHKQLVVGLLFINIFLLFPLALIAYYWGNFISIILSIIVILMCLLWSIIQLTYQNKFNAGNLT